MVATPKDEARCRRMAVLFGLIGAAGMFALRYGVMTSPLEATRLLWFDISGWPHYMRSFLPLDFAEVCAGFAVVMYMFFRYGDNMHPKGTQGWLKFLLGYFVAIGSFGAVLLSAMDGWIFGIEGFFLLPALLAVVLLGLACGCVSFFVAGWLVRQGWLRVRTMSIAQPIIRFGRYINADDAQDDRPDAA